MPRRVADVSIVYRIQFAFVHGELFVKFIILQNMIKFADLKIYRIYCYNYGNGAAGLCRLFYILHNYYCVWINIHCAAFENPAALLMSGFVQLDSLW